MCPANYNELNNKNNSYHLLNVQSHVARKWKCKREFICDWVGFTIRLEIFGGGGSGGGVLALSLLNRGREELWWGDTGMLLALE